MAVPVWCCAVVEEEDCTNGDKLVNNYIQQFFLDIKAVINCAQVLILMIPQQRINVPASSEQDTSFNNLGAIRLKANNRVWCKDLLLSRRFAGVKIMSSILKRCAFFQFSYYNFLTIWLIFTTLIDLLFFADWRRSVLLQIKSVFLLLSGVQ